MNKCTDSLTLGEIRELMGLFGTKPPQNSPFIIGENYLIRTVTMMLLGRLESVGSTELVLSSAVWVADSGRFYDALKNGKLDEVEPFINDVIVGRGSIVDATIWTHKLPKEQK